MIDAIGIVRAIQVGATLALFGGFVFHLVVAPAALAAAPEGDRSTFHRRFVRLMLASLVVALAAALLWLLLEAGAMSDAETLGDALAAVPPALLETRFGRVLLARAALLALSGSVLVGWPGGVRSPLRTAAGALLASAAVALVAASGHAAAAMESRERETLVLVEAAHLLAAGGWLGGLAPLLLALLLPPHAAARAAQRFSPLGIAAVLVLAASALLLGWRLIASLPGLVGTAYGGWALVKLALFAAMLGLAARHRWRFTAALARGNAPGLQRRFRLSVAAETALGVLVVLAAGQLASAPPAIHEQPWWPLPLRFSSAPLGDGARYLAVLGGAFAALAGLALLGFALVRARRRWPAAIAGAALLATAAPVLLAATTEPAYPTSFWRSPTGFTAVSIARGEATFARSCAACHGPGGRGDGPAAEAMHPPPADLTAPHLWAHPDGDLFWWISRGIPNAMPGFAATLEPRTIWQVVDFLHANAAGATVGPGGGVLARPVPAPGLDALCPGGERVPLAALQGRPILVVTAPAPGFVRAAAALRGVVVMLSLGNQLADARPDDWCIAGDEAAARAAFAVLAGRGASALAGSAFLVDARGLLRREWFPGGTPDWHDPAVLEAEIDAIRGRPPQPAALPSHDHQHMH